MLTKLLSKPVGRWQMNTYVVICEDSGASAIIDPGADVAEILALAQGTHIEKILLTHAHPDHTGALAEVISASGAPVFLHPADAQEFDFEYDVPLADGDVIEVGSLRIRAIHTPGHTPGITCFDIGQNRVIVGDTIFVDGPGKTGSAKDFATTMHTMQNIVFAWPDVFEFYPGHGPSGRIREERPAFEAFVTRGWAPDLYGDVVWV